MIRIVLIGNGFDLAHGLKTSYRDFINDYWEDFKSQIVRGKIKIGEKMVPGAFYEDDLLYFFYTMSEWSESLLASVIDSRADDFFRFGNKFWKYISRKASLKNWVDIESEYYKELKKCLNVEDEEDRHKMIETLNNDFAQIKGLLEKYLTKVAGNKSEQLRIDSIDEMIGAPIDFRHLSRSCQDWIIDCGFEMDVHVSGSKEKWLSQERKYKSLPLDMAFESASAESRKERKAMWLDESNYYGIPVKDTLFLNFNYTNFAEKLYALSDMGTVINIHGELNNPANPIIFGYGDEMDEDYRKIEALNDNDFLENVKSIRYLETDNYRRMLDFIESDKYQVCVMGHSCDNSDRTLLSMLFGHDNCVSVKVFYHQREDGSDNYSEVVRNISRNFADKAKLRAVVVPHNLSVPLVGGKQ